MKPSRRLAPALVLCAAALGLCGVAAAADTAPLTVAPPRVALSGIPATLRVETAAGLAVVAVPVEVLDDDGRIVGTAEIPSGGAADVEVTLRGFRRHVLVVRAPGLDDRGVDVALRSIPGWLSLAPPLLAIVLALALRQVVPALLAGVWLGGWIAFGNPLVGFLRTLDHYVVKALSDPDHVSIVVFSLLLGGMVGVLSRSGGTQGMVDSLAARATTSARGQTVTWLLGVAVFFDDYANTLVVGNTMRPVTDRLRISREKLAYIVDSTSAPVAAIGILSTWIGYEVSLIADALSKVGSSLDAYGVFLEAIEYNFYPILALVFGFAIAWSRRDFGPMLAAERRAMTGKLLRDGAVPLADFDSESLGPIPGRPRRWWNAVVPVVSVLCVTFLAQWLSGRVALAAAGDPLGSSGLLGLGLRGIGTVFTSGDSFRSLLYGAATGCAVAILLARAQGILTVAEGLDAWAKGLKSMVLAFVILTLAWSIAEVCADLQASGYVAAALSGVLDPRLLPMLVFAIASMISFATGTSWATMGILVPLAVPAAFGVAHAAGFGPEGTHRIFMGAVAAVLSGAIFGDHCSPISDTTVMSSMSSGCDHVDHVRTQLPYALTVAAIVLLCGYLPEAFGLSPWGCLALGAAASILVVRFVGRPVAG